MIFYPIFTMEIIWHGYKCFTVKTKSGSIIVDPYSAESGLTLSSKRADAIVFTEEENKENNPEAVSDNPKIFNWPGEYEVAGIALNVRELPLSKSKEKKNPILMTFEVDNIRIGYLTDLTMNITDEMIEEFGNIDIFIIPVDQKNNDYKQFNAIMEEIEPRIVIPIDYVTPGLTLKIDEIGPFLKKIGIESAQTQDKFSANSKSNLPSEKTEFVVLNPQV